MRTLVPQESSRCDLHPTGSVIMSAAAGGERNGVHEEEEEEEGWSASQRSGTADKGFGRKGLANGCIPRRPARLFLPVKTRDCELLFWLEQERHVWSLVLVLDGPGHPSWTWSSVCRSAQA